MGAGPFTVVSDTLSNTLVLKKNPNYWQTGHPYLDNLTFKATADDEAALEALQSGGAQAYDGMATPSLVSTYKSHFTTTEQPATSPYDIQLNTAAPPFNNVKARQAIYYATDAAIIDQKLFGNQFQVVQGFTAPGGLFYYPNVPGYPTYDLAKAKSLVKETRRADRELLHARLTGQPELHGGAPELWKAGGDQHLDPPVQPGRADPAVRHQEVAGGAADRGGVGSGRGRGSRIPVPVRLAVQRRARPEARRADPRRPGAVNPTARDKTYQQAAQYIAKNADGPFLFPLASWNVAVHGVQGPGLTTVIPSVVVNTAAAVAGRLIHPVTRGAAGIAPDE